MTTTATSRPDASETIASTGAFTVDFRALVDALKTVALPTLGHKSLPVFSRVSAVVRLDEVVLTAYDLDVAVTVTLPARQTAPGRMLLEHSSVSKILAAAIKGCSRSDVTSSR